MKSLQYLRMFQTLNDDIKNNTCINTFFSNSINESKNTNTNTLIIGKYAFNIEEWQREISRITKAPCHFLQYKNTLISNELLVSDAIKHTNIKNLIIKFDHIRYTFAIKRNNNSYRSHRENIYNNKTESVNIFEAFFNTVLLYNLLYYHCKLHNIKLIFIRPFNALWWCLKHYFERDKNVIILPCVEFKTSDIYTRNKLLKKIINFITK